MLITIQNDKLKLTVDTFGAQMMALEDANGTQYLWDGNPQYWSGRAPVLFPFIGRLTNNSYCLRGKPYSMGIHGFAKSQAFSVEQQTDDSLTLLLTENEATLAQFPFAFALRITYALKDSQVQVRYEVENHSETTMPFGLGGHPGFRVPMAQGDVFSDYVLEFTEKCQPDRVGFTPSVYLSGQDERYPLENGNCIRLRHELFDDDAIILKNMDREITLRSTKSGAGLRVTYLRMPYLGIWHMPKTDAPYVCIEPWTSLPARQDVVEEFTCKSDLIQLPSSENYENEWSITIL